MAMLSEIEERIFKRRSRQLRKLGRRLDSLRIKSESITKVKAILTHHAPGLSLFKKGERNLIIRAGGQHIGDFFVSDYLPLRFNMKYATAVLYYNPTAKYEAWKAYVLGYSQPDQGEFADTSRLEPLVLTGALRESALNKSYAVSRAANGRFSVLIRIPTPATANGFRYSSNKEVRKVLRSLPQKEVRALANRLGRFIQHQIGQSTLIQKKATPKREARSIRRLGDFQRSSLRDLTTSRSSLRTTAVQRYTPISTSYDREAG